MKQRLLKQNTDLWSCWPLNGSKPFCLAEQRETNQSHNCWLLDGFCRVHLLFVWAYYLLSSSDCSKTSNTVWKQEEEKESRQLCLLLSLAFLGKAPLHPTCKTGQVLFMLKACGSFWKTRLWDIPSAMCLPAESPSEGAGLPSKKKALQCKREEQVIDPVTGWKAKPCARTAA